MRLGAPMQVQAVRCLLGVALIKPGRALTLADEALLDLRLRRLLVVDVCHRSPTSHGMKTA